MIKKKLPGFLITAIVLIIAVIFSSYITVPEDENTPPAPRVKKIILMIGDGMGIAQVTGAITISKDNLNMTTSKYLGLVKTQSYDDYITDSAASGTAMATGEKTKNGMVGMSPDSTKLINISELIRERKNMSYGVVSTSAVTHATPASFVAHNVNRNDYEGIALDFVRNQPDVFIGGGRDHFNDRKDERDLIKVLEDQGYVVALNMEDLYRAKGEKLAGLLAEGHMPRFAEGRDLMLAESTAKAIQILNQNRHGFLLMVEGSQIDWGGHANDGLYVLEETYDFDIAVGVAIDFAKNDRNTLVIVTADHETGGMTLPGGNLEENSVFPKFSAAGHTGTLVPLFAFGAEAEKFTGVYDNTELFKKMAEVLRLQ